MTRVLALLLLVSWPAHAVAQSDDPRALFEDGSLAVREGRFAEGRELLERSLAIAPRPATAFNLVVALRGMGALVSAASTCDRLLGGAWGAIDDAHRAEADTQCAEIAASVAHLEVALTGDAPGEIRLDGIALGTLPPGESLERAIDPGAHALTLLSPGRATLDRSLDVARGAHVSLSLAVPPREAHDDSLAIGLAVGGGVLALVVVAVVVGVAIASAPGPQPGDFPITMTLSQ
jgi:hypothetical protein